MLAHQQPAQVLCRMPVYTLQVVLLMPFMATDWSSSRQRVLRFAASLAPLLGAVAGAVGRLPGWLQDRLVALVQPGVEPHARGSMKALMTAGGVHNNFHLARHEFRWDAAVVVESIAGGRAAGAAP